MDWEFTNTQLQPTMIKHLGLLIMGFVLGPLTYGFINFEEAMNGPKIVLSGLLGVFVVYGVYGSNYPLNRFLPWKNNTGLRLLAGIVWNVFLGFVLIYFAVWAYSFFSQNGELNSMFHIEAQLKLGILLLSGSVIYCIVYFAFYSYNQYAFEQINELKIERKQSELQLATLKAQLSPHFLFNSINSLSALFHSDMKRAEDFIRAMAKSYQYTLDNHRASLISVEKELEFANSYAYLLKTRHGDAFQLQTKLKASHLRSSIPPLTLQILIENAVKHNALSTKEPITVTISGNDTYLKISNNKAQRKNTKPSTGIGLKNITSRYQILSGNKISVENSDEFTVKLPLLSNG